MDAEALLDQVSGLDDQGAGAGGGSAGQPQAASASANGSPDGQAQPSWSTAPRVPGEHPKWPAGVARGITKVSYTHAAMVDEIVANPCISQLQLAAHFGYSVGWISQVISSDAFQAQLAARTGQLVDPVLQSTIETRFKGLVARSLEILAEKLSGPTSTIPDNLALRALELSSRALGYGARPEAKIEVNVTNHLDQLGENLVGLLKKKKMEVLAEEAVDGQVVQSG